MSSARRAFGAGELSHRAFRKYLMSTSQDGQELHPDDQLRMMIQGKNRW